MFRSCPQAARHNTKPHAQLTSPSPHNMSFRHGGAHSPDMWGERMRSSSRRMRLRTPISGLPAVPTPVEAPTLEPHQPPMVGRGVSFAPRATSNTRCNRRNKRVARSRGRGGGARLQQITAPLVSSFRSCSAQVPPQVSPNAEVPTLLDIRPHCWSKVVRTSPCLQYHAGGAGPKRLNKRNADQDERKKRGGMRASRSARASLSRMLCISAGRCPHPREKRSERRCASRSRKEHACLVRLWTSP